MKANIFSPKMFFPSTLRPGYGSGQQQQAGLIMIRH